MQTVLIADDNNSLQNILKLAVEKAGYRVILASDGKEALDIFKETIPTIVLLDVMMPKIDGFEVCKTIRKNYDTPIIMITAKGEDYDKIMGLEIGADDYIVKPFSPAEIVARIKAILRRVKPDDIDSSVPFKISNLEINLDNYTVKIDDNLIPLTKRETDMLYTLAQNKNRAFSRDQLLDLLWGYDYYGDARTVDSHIKRLRAKLSKIPHPCWEIKTIRNVGYKFEEKINE